MNLAPRPPLLPLDTALAQLLAAATPLAGTQTVATMDADGRVLAHDVVSGLQVPAHDNSAMDGYAVRSADAQSAGALLPVTQRIPAGSVGTALAPGCAARIFTGAPIPPGADAVVMQEDCRVADGVAGSTRVGCSRRPQSCDSRRRAGGPGARDRPPLAPAQIQ